MSNNGQNKSIVKTPYAFGKPKNKLPIYILFLITIFGSWGLSTLTLYNLNVANLWNIVLPLVITFLVYTLLTNFMFVDFKKYSNYWIIHEKYISYNRLATPDKNEILQNFLLPIIAFFNYTNKEEVKYSEINTIEVNIELFERDPNVSVVFGLYTPRYFHFMRENAYLTVTTKSDKKITLNLQQVIHYDTRDRKELYSILSFFESKGIQVIDKYNISTDLENETFDLAELYLEDNT